MLRNTGLMKYKLVKSIGIKVWLKKCQDLRSWKQNRQLVKKNCRY